MQALEALKLLAGMPKATVLARRMCIYDALAGEFRNMKTRQRSPKCAVCGDAPTIRSIADSAAWCKERDLVPAEDQQCSVRETLPPLHQAQRLSCAELRSRLPPAGSGCLLLDVREPVQFEICALPGAKNVPLKDLKKPEKMGEVFAEAAGRPVYVICRRGVDSVTATHNLLEYASAQDDGKGGAMSNRKFYNIDGGLQEWHRQVDPSFPIY
jgi:adenylyltransferase/sulfurtransferase